MKFLLAMLVLVACAACSGASRTNASTPSSPSSSTSHHALAAGLTLVDLDVAPTRDASIEEVATMKKDSNDDATKIGVVAGHRAVFFYDFDAASLFFVVARALPEPEDPPMKRSTRWKVEERLRVARTDAAMKTLGVAGTVAMYEDGVCGVHVGDAIDDVKARLGKETKQLPPAASDCMGYVFGASESTNALYVNACHGAVTHVEREGTNCP
jgi:hypothetical protein